MLCVNHLSQALHQRYASNQSRRRDASTLLLPVDQPPRTIGADHSPDLLIGVDQQAYDNTYAVSSVLQQPYVVSCNFHRRRSLVSGSLNVNCKSLGATIRHRQRQRRATKRRTADRPCVQPSPPPGIQSDADADALHAAFVSDQQLSLGSPRPGRDRMAGTQLTSTERRYQSQPYHQIYNAPRWNVVRTAYPRRKF